MLKKLIEKVQEENPEIRIVSALEFPDKYAISTCTRKWNGITERPTGGIEGFSINKNTGEIKPYGMVLLCQDITDGIDINRISVSKYLSKEDSEFIEKYC